MMSMRPIEARCPAAVGRAHAFFKSHRDGHWRCCYCVKTRDEIRQAPTDTGGDAA